VDWLADCPFYTRRFAFFVGRRCRESTIADVARETSLDWKTIKALEEQYMREQLRRVGTPGPKIIGIDEISVGRGHRYCIVVSDLLVVGMQSGFFLNFDETEHHAFARLSRA